MTYMIVYTIIIIVRNLPIALGLSDGLLRIIQSLKCSGPGYSQNLRMPDKYWT
jgi:hypothetical protein